MKPKTMILMVVAVGCGLGASYMTSRLLAERNKQTEEVPSVPVLVVKARAPSYQTIKDPEKYFEVKLFPQDVAPKKAIGSFADLKDQKLNKALDEGKPVTQDDLLTKEQQDISSQLLPGQRAVAIKVTAESLAGGFVLPGTRVDVVCTSRGNNDPNSKVVLQNMLVLAVDVTDTRNPEQRTILGQTVTLAATPNEATRLTLAGAVGDLRLMLKGLGDTTKVGEVTTRIGDLEKPLGPGGTANEGSSSDAPPATAALPVIPEDSKAPPAEEPKTVPAAPRRKHVMTIYVGTQKEKAIFHEGEDEDVAGSPLPPTQDQGKAEEPKAPVAPVAPPAAKPPEPKTAPKPQDAPAAPKGPASPFGKSNRTGKVQ